MIPLLITILFLIIIFFPFCLNANVVFIKELKRMYFDTNIFNIIKIKSGYLEFYQKKLYIHHKKNKAKLLKIPSLNESKKKIKPYLDLHVKEINLVISIGQNNNPVFINFSCFLFNYFANLLFRILEVKKPYIKKCSKINIYDNNKTNLYLKIKIYLNFLLIFLNIFKNIKEKIQNATRKRKHKV